MKKRFNSNDHHASAVSAKGVRRPTWWVFLFAVWITIPVGCSLFQKDKPGQSPEILKAIEQPKADSESAKPNASESKAEEVRLDGGLLLGDTENLAFQPSEFAQLIQQMIEEEQWVSIRGLLLNYPELVVRILRQNDQLSRAELTKIAIQFEQISSGKSGANESKPGSWQSYVEYRLKSGKRQSSGGSFTELCREFQDELTNNRPSTALKLKLENPSLRRPRLSHGWRYCGWWGSRI